MKKLALTLGTALLLVACTPQATNTTPTTPTPTINGSMDDNAMMDDSNPDAMEAMPTAVATPTGNTNKAMVKTITLAEQNDSGQTGTAQIIEKDGKAVVTLTMTGTASTVPQPAHIHTGRCPEPGAIKYNLTNVVNGKSVTTLAVDLNTLWADADNLAVNVHKSAQDLKTYTACGNLE